MLQRILLCSLVVSALAVVATGRARAQDAVPDVSLPGAVPKSWLQAEGVAASLHKVDVVTFDQPERQRGCRIQSITDDKLVCSRAFGKTRTYLRQQVLALIVPGDHKQVVRDLVILNAGGLGAIWGTVALIGVCPACAIGTAIAAVALLAAGGAVLYGDDNDADYLLYLAPGQDSQHLTGKLRKLSRKRPG